MYSSVILPSVVLFITVCSLFIRQNCLGGFPVGADWELVQRGLLGVLLQELHTKLPKGLPGVAQGCPGLPGAAMPGAAWGCPELPQIAPN